MHADIGTTKELGHYVRRAMVIEHRFGDGRLRRAAERFV